MKHKHAFHAEGSYSPLEQSGRLDGPERGVAAPRLVSAPGPAVSAHSSSPEASAPFMALLVQAACHELYAAREADAPSATAMALGCALQFLQGRPLLWVRHDLVDLATGSAYAPGLGELGLDLAQLTLLRAREARSVLQAGLEGARCAALGAVVVELWGETRLLDLTASRRLALAAKASKTPLFLVRVAAAPQPSAAETRWQVRAAPSRALAANAPGPSIFDLTLLRHRNGQEGLRCHMEWDADARTFTARPIAGGAPIVEPHREQAGPPLSRRVVPFSLDRPCPHPAGALVTQAG